MDWLGGLSNITDQISNITKDILAEGTVELSDPKVRLEVARSRITELESAVAARGTEVDSLKTKNAELEVQLESTQLRLDHIKEQFTTQLSDKEKIISKLQAMLSNERGEPEGQLSSATADAHLGNEFNQPRIVSEQSMSEFVSEDYPPTDTVSRDGTASWQELRNEVVQLRLDVSKWRRIAKQKKQKSRQQQSAGAEHARSDMDWQREIDELKQQLLDVEETRQLELTTLRENHTVHTANLVEQLRDTEAEIVLLREKLDRSETSVEEMNAMCQSLSAIKSPDDVKEKPVKKKNQRGGKKKSQQQAKLLTADTRADSPRSISLLDVKQSFQDCATQTYVLDISMETSSEYEKVDASPRLSPPISMVYKNVESQTEYTVETADVQTVILTSTTTEIQTLPIVIDSVSIGVQVSHDIPTHVVSATNQSPAASTSAMDDRASTLSDLSDISSYSHQLEDVVRQLSAEIETYEDVVSNVLSSAVVPTSNSQKNLDGNDGSLADQNIDTSSIAHQLFVLQNSLKKRNAKLVAIRKAHKKKRYPSTQLDKGSDSSASLIEVPKNDFTSMTSGFPPILLDGTTENEDTGWQIDDFPELKTPLSSPSTYDKRIFSLDDKNTQTLKPSESSETLIYDLKETVQILQSRLHENRVSYETRLQELETSYKLFERLQSLLQSAMDQLSPHLPAPPFIEDPNIHIPPWPPTDPEAQLNLLITAEWFARNECEKARNDAFLHDAQTAKHEPQPRGCDTRDAPDVEDVGVDIENKLVEYAHSVCLALDMEYTQSNWDPDQWDAVLYDLLKPRFVYGCSSETDESPADQIVRLSAEVVALRDILDQHANFRSQAEQDLHQLLATVSDQRVQIENLSAEKEKLECDLSDQGHSIHSRQNENEEMSRIAIQQLSELVRGKEEEIELLQRRCDELKSLVQSDLQHKASIPSGDFKPESSDKSVEIKSEDSTTLIERLTSDLSTSKDRVERVETMYESVVAALHQKHTESQSYHAELERVYGEFVNCEERNRTMQQEVDFLRDQVADLQSHLAEAQELASTSSITSSNELKLQGELRRLQAHLIEMEESYTAEALNAENREVDLRTELREVTSHLIQLEASGQTSEQRVQTMQTNLDEANSRASAYAEEIKALNSSLLNLQSVLDNFQHNQQATITSETEHLRLELQRARQRETNSVTECERIKQQLEDYEHVKQVTRDLQGEIGQFMSQLANRQIEIQQRDAQIDELRNRLARMAVDTDSKIDKTLMKNLLLSYFQLPSNQRQNGLHVVGNLLQFTNEEFERIGAADASGIPRLFGWVRSAVASLPAGPPKDVTFSSVYPDKSFTELLLAFLQRESESLSTFRMSMEHYTQESVRPPTSDTKPSGARFGKIDSLDNFASTPSAPPTLKNPSVLS